MVDELPLSAEQEQLMDIVLRESERLNTTIRSFLAYARPQHKALLIPGAERAPSRVLLSITAQFPRGGR